MAKPNDFFTTPNNDFIRLSLISACCLYPNAGVMLLNNEGKKLFWINEPDNDKATKIRDEIVAKLTA